MPFINNLLLGITNLRTKAGEKLNSLYADIGVKNNLTTANKSNLVGAVNEVNAKFIPYENAIKDADLNNKSLNNVNNIDTKNLKINTLNGILKTINGVVSIATPQVDYLTSVDLSAYATQVWVNSQGFLKSVPIASASTLGIIKVGTNLSISGDGTLSSNYINTTYSDGNGIKLVGTQFSMEVSVNGSGNTITDITQTADGISITKANVVNYTLPTATASVLGGIKVGSNLSIDGNGVLSATNTVTTYTAGAGLTQSGTIFSLPVTTNGSGGVVTNVTQNANGITITKGDVSGYTLPTATASVLGGIKVGSNLSIDGNGVLSATNTVTTYTAGNGLTLSGTTFSLPITTNGSGNGVSSITQTSTGITQNLTNFALLNHSHAFSEITSKPTTIGGYGITDAIVNNITNTVSDSFILKNNNTSLSVTNTGVNVKNNNNEQVVIKPNALTIINSSGDRRNLNYPYPVGGMIINDFIATSVNGIKANDQGDVPLSFSNLLNKPTTINGYGITDAMNKTSENIVSPTWFITNDSNYTAVSFPYDDKQGLEIGAGGLITRYAPNGIFPNLVVFEAQYQYQNLYFPKSTNKSRLEDRVLITSINGILADERGNVIIPNGGGGTIDTSNFVVKNASNNLTKDFQLVSSRSANNDFFTIRSSEGYASGRNGLMLEGLDDNVEGTRVIISRDGFIVSNSDGGSFDYKGNVFEGYNGTIFKASAFYETSLRKYKENITSYNESALQLVNDLEIVKFDRNDNLEKNVIGVIADDTNESFLSNSKDSVDLYKTIFIQAKAIQELSKRLKKLEKINNV